MLRDSSLFLGHRGGSWWLGEVDGIGEGAVHSVSPPPVGDMLSPESSPCLSGGSCQQIYVDKFSALVFCVHFPFLRNF